MDFRKLRREAKKSVGRRRTRDEGDTPTDDAFPAAETDPIEDIPEDTFEATGQDQSELILTAEDDAFEDVDPEEFAGYLYEQDADENTAMLEEVLRFRLGSEYFALRLSEIEEIIKPKSYTPVPRMPDWILGIVSLRGTMVPVVDTAKRLGIESDASTTRRIIIVSHEGEWCGLLADEVRNVELVDAARVEPIPAALMESAGRFLSGLIRVENQLIAMLDISATLSLEGWTVERASR